MEKEDIKYTDVLLETDKYVVKGQFELPEPSVVENPTIDNLLFYSLNCGNKFVSLSNCIVSAKDSSEYQPEEVDHFNINLDIVQTCRIVKK